MSFIGATGLDEHQENYDELNDKIDANASYINTLVGIPDPTHLPLYGINILNPGLYGLVERAEVNIRQLQTQGTGQGSTISGIETTISGIESSITGIQGEITAIEGQITAVEGSLSTIQFTELPLIASAITGVGGVAGDALVKANKSLGIWDEDGNNTYNMKSGNVGIGILPKGTILNNKLEVNGNINISAGSKYKINNVDLSYSDLAGTPPVSSKWTNASDVVTNIYYNSGNIGIGVTSAINNKLEVGGNLNISAGSKYKINNVNLAFSDLGGTLSYNSLTDKLTAGNNISIVGNAINNTYSLPTATSTSLGSVRPDNSTITITNGVISAAAGTPQVNSDWTQTNDNLKSFIQNKPTAGNNISFANNTITNTITGSPTQNIIGLNTNQLIVVDKPNSQKIDEVFTPLTNEPTITSPAFTESIRVFTHSGGTETQTPYTITIGQNTICDILIVGGGGGGTAGHGAGGGAGQLVLIHQAILSGTYTIKVGKGGNGSTLSGTSSTMGTITNGTKGSNSEFGNASVNVIAEGGGISVDTTLRDGGSGAGGDGHTPDGGSGGKGLKNTIVDTFSSGNVYSRGNNGGDGSAVSSGNVGQGGGGGGAGTAGTAGGLNNDSAIGHGGDGLSGISEINYDFKTNFGNYGKLEADGKYWFAGGGAGGVYYINSSVVSNGGKGGGASTPPSVLYGKINGNNAVNNTGGGGAGGSAWYGNGGNGGSGIVIIKLRTIVNSAIPEGNPITHKTLNFTYNNNLLFYYRKDESPWSWQEAYNEALANGRRLPTITELRNHMTNNPSLFTHWNGIDTWVAVVNQAVANSKDFVQVGSSAQHIRGRSHVQDVGSYPSWGDGSNQYGDIYFEVLDLAQTNQYTLSVPLSGTGVIINNTPLQYLSAGNYTISVGATQSSVVIAGIGQVGSDPYPLTNGSTISFKYSMTQRIQVITNYKKDGLIKYIPASGTNPSTGTWQMIDVDSQALTQFAGNLPFTRIDGNLPASKLDPIDMSKVSTGQLPISRTDGNLPASRLDAIDMSKVSTGNLYYNRISDSHLLVNERFHRIIYAWENVVDTMGVWTNKFQVNTNLHLNYYNQAYNYYRFYLSLSPNNTTDRHKYWFGVVKYSFKSGTDNNGFTLSHAIDANNFGSFEIKDTTSSSGVFWLNIWIYTTSYCESMLCTLH